jgi:hypothetical protein
MTSQPTKRPRRNRGGRNFDGLPDHVKERIQREKEAVHARNRASRNDDIWDALRKKMAASSTPTNTQ